MHWFNNLKVSRKLGLGFGIILVLLIGLGIFSLGELSRMNRSAVDLAANWLPSLRALGQMQYDVVDLRRKEMSFLLAADKKEIATEEGRSAAVYNRLVGHMKEYEKFITSGDERNLYQEFTRDLEKHESVRLQVNELIKAGKHREGVRLSQTQGRDSSEALVKKLAEDVEVNHQGADTATRIAFAAYTSSRYWIIGAVVAALGGANRPGSGIAGRLRSPRNRRHRHRR
jgi:methyl-accepting chemotaxis protein